MTMHQTGRQPPDGRRPAMQRFAPSRPPRNLHYTGDTHMDLTQTFKVSPRSPKLFSRAFMAGTALCLSWAVHGTAFAAVQVVTSENIAPPATKLKSASLVSPTDARTFFGGAITHTVGLSNLASPEIAAVSKALRGQRNVSDPTQQAQFVQNVSDYVRNNIATEFRYGLSKGGRGALIDQSGTPFDQAELMILLLRQQGVTASFVTGDVTLTATQFGKWTGLVTGLNESAQTFTVNASAACGLLADGGIPATVNGASTCSGLSGNLSSVTMSHIWVQVGSTLYDPSYKEHLLANGIDVPSAMGCGGPVGSTCGNTVMTAGMSGATQSTTSSGIPYVGNFNLAGAKTAHDALKLNLLNYVKTQNIKGQSINASVFDVLGGKKIVPQSLSNAPLSYTASTTWTDIPNQYRTKLSIQQSLQGNDSCQNPNLFASFYADEIASRPLFFKQGLKATSSKYTVDGADIQTLSYVQAAGCVSGIAPYIQISVDHPYAAAGGAYADEVVNFKTVDPPADETGASRSMRPEYLYPEAGGPGRNSPAPYALSQQLYATDYPEQNYVSVSPIAIVHNFGQAGQSAQRSMADLISVLPPPTEACVLTTASNKIDSRACNYPQQATVAETFAYMRTLTGQLVDGVAKTVTTRHHDIGIVYAGRAQGMTLTSVQESESIAPVSGLAQDQQSGFDMNALALAEAEARSNAIDSASGISAARNFFFKLGHDYDFSPVAGRIYDISPTNMGSYVAALPNTTAFTDTNGVTNYGYNCITYYNIDGSTSAPAGCWRQQALTDVAGQGYSTLIMEGGQGELFYKGTNERALTMWEYVKGGTTIGDGLSTAIKTTEIVDQGALRRKFLSVSPSTGDLKYTAGADIVTGSGSFPHSLALVRTFSAGPLERGRNTASYYYDQSSGALITNPATAADSSGPDSQYHDRLGGGWTHNFQVRLQQSNDLTYQLGSENALFASEFIANLQIIKDLGTTNNLTNKITSLFAIANMTRTLPGSGGGTSNTVTVMKGAATTVFHNTIVTTIADQSASDKWVSSSEPDAKITFNGQQITYTSRDGDQIAFSPYRYDSIPIDGATNTFTQNLASQIPGKILKADTWSFPDGETVSFSYDAVVLSSPPTCQPNDYPLQYTGQYGYLLRRVSNNLGRALNFTYDQQWVRQQLNIACQKPSQPYIYYPGYAYSPATYNTYRLKQVTDDAGHSVTFAIDSNLINGTYFTATDPLNQVTRYEYSAGADSPDPANIRRNNYQLRRWFSAANGSSPYQSILYDDMFRVTKVTDRNNNSLIYYPSALFSSEMWKRTEELDGNGNASLENYDDKNGNILSRNAVGSTTLRTFDNASHLLRTQMPEGNAVEQSFDMRGNVVRTCRIGKDRSGQSCNTGLDSVTTTTFNEGPTVLTCANLVICNKPASETDARTNTTNYTWNTTTGQLTQILKPAVWSAADAANIRPQIDATYTTIAGLSLLTSKTEKISGAQNVVTAFEYDSANGYELKSVIVDNGGLALRTCLKYDSSGNLISKTDPNANLSACQ